MQSTYCTYSTLQHCAATYIHAWTAERGFNLKTVPLIGPTYISAQVNCTSCWVNFQFQLWKTIFMEKMFNCSFDQYRLFLKALEVKCWDCSPLDVMTFKSTTSYCLSNSTTLLYLEWWDHGIYRKHLKYVQNEYVLKLYNNNIEDLKNADISTDNCAQGT